MEIEWKVGKSAGDNMYYYNDFLIFREGSHWILSYTDNWSFYPESFVVNVRSKEKESVAVDLLKKYLKLALFKSISEKDIEEINI